MSVDFGRIRRVLLIVLALNVAVAVAKYMAGMLTGSVSMQADGLHSFVDASSNLVGLAGVWLARRPADENHPYGHGKYETLASIGIGAFLIFTVVEIVRDAVADLIERSQPTVTAISFAVMIGTLLINIGVTLWEQREGRRLGSEVLLADAAQTRSDIFVSLAVIVSLIAARLGFSWLDPVVALGVAALVARAAWQVLRRASSVLSDEAALPREELDELARSTPGVQGTHRIWTRGQENEVYVDLDIQVDAGMTVEQGHEVAHNVRERIRRRWPAVRHIMVHVEPVIPDDTSTTQRVYHVARQHNLNVHDVRVRATRGREEVGLHLEVDPALTLGEAHAKADDLERAILADLPGVRRVTTHLEGVAEEPLPLEDITASSPNLVALVKQVAEVVIGEGRCHAVRVYRHGQGDDATYDLALHCTLPANLPLEEAHDRSEEIERGLRAALPTLNAVTVHTEPPVQERLAHGRW